MSFSSQKKFYLFAFFYLLVCTTEPQVLAADFDYLSDQVLQDIKQHFDKCGIQSIDVRSNPIYNRREIDAIFVDRSNNRIGFFRERVGVYEITGPFSRSFSIRYFDHRISFSTPYEGTVARANTYLYGWRDLRLNVFCKYYGFYNNQQSLSECVTEQFTRPLINFMCYNSSSYKSYKIDR